MAETLRDLVEWYPFLPWETYTNTSIPEIVYAVLDIRVVIVLDATDEPWKFSEKGQPMFGDVRLIATDDEHAIVRIYDIFNHPDNQNYINNILDVYIGQDVHPNPYSSYIVMSKPINWSGELTIHPDCVLFLQKAPWLWFTQFPIIQEMTKMMFDWYSLSVTYNTDYTVAVNSITFTANSGRGSGLCPVGVEHECAVVSHAPIGLRSINGFSGNVVLSAMPPVALTITAEIGDDGLSPVLRYPVCDKLVENPDNKKYKDLRLTIMPLVGGVQEDEDQNEEQDDTP